MEVSLMRPLLCDDYDAAEFYKLIRVNRIGENHHLSHLKWADDATFESTKQFLKNAAASDTEDFFFIGVDGKIAGAAVLRSVKLTSDTEQMIGYWLGQEYCGKGVATVAVRQLLREAKYRRVIATVRCENEASRSVLRNNKFVEAGRLADKNWSLFVWTKRK